MKEQPVKSQKAEIKFRKELVQQQIDEKSIFGDEYDKKGIEKVLRDRMKETFNQMRLLKESGITLSPYLDLGAERCQRSLVMENDLGATGLAVDISYHMLKSCDYYKDVFNKSKVPLRICCDAYSLPFMTNSIPFVFCYETLHHFPDPAPIIKEVYRVLASGGWFFFDKEPYRRTLYINLYKREKNLCRQKRYSQRISLSTSEIEKIFYKITYKIKKICDGFFSEKILTETKRGIIENDNLSLNLWRKALSLFEEKDVKLQSPNRVDSELFNPRHYKELLSPGCINSELFNPEHPIRFLLAYLFGGAISGICRKAATDINWRGSVYDILICPWCLKNKHQSKLIQKNSTFFCSKCGNKFPIVEDVAFLFSYEKFRELYPEIFKNFQIISK